MIFNITLLLLCFCCTIIVSEIKATESQVITRHKSFAFGFNVSQRML